MTKKANIESASKMRGSLVTTPSDDLSGSIEIIVQHPLSTQHDDNDNNNNHRKHTKPLKPVKQISNMIRRMKPPTVRRSKSVISRNSSIDNPLVEISLRKAQSVIITSRSGNTTTSSIRQVRSSNDFGTCPEASRTSKTGGEREKQKLLSSDSNHGISPSAEDQHYIPLVSSSVSGDDNTLHKSPSESDLKIQTSSSSLSLYNMISYPWRTTTESSGINDNKENESPLTNNDTSLVRKGSALNLDDENTSSGFFFKEDFDSTVWYEVNATNGISILGAAVMTATVVIHPMVFVAGAATAVWAVGFLHGLEKGYQFFSDGSFSDLFWSDSNEEQEVILEDNKLVTPRKCSSRDLVIATAVNDDSNYTDLITPSTPASFFEVSPPHKKHLSSQDDIIKNFFPDLEYAVVENVAFTGLNALEFFEVYFADEAPYSFKEFQATKGDIDIMYNKWNRRSNDVEKQSFHPNANQNGFANFPTSSKKERELTFKTLTKSYFGPAYANAKKTQRVTKFSTRLVIIESKTELFDIPFCDRFFVVERWIVESEKHDQPSSMSSSTPTPIYTSKLSVFVEVIMLKSCKFERQIRDKTLSTLTAMLEEWTQKATKALDLATRKNMERRRIGHYDDGTSIRSYRSNRKTLYNSPSQEEAMKKHHQKLKVIEEKIFSSDMDWCNIEIRHSVKAGAQAAFAEIVDQKDESSDCPQEISIQSSSTKPQKKKVMRLFRSKKQLP